VAKKTKYEKENEPTPGHIARNKLDTRADTICAGANFLCIHPTGMTCNVQGFHQSFTPIPEIPVATVATAWDDPATGQTLILVVHQALYFGNQLDHSLINAMTHTIHIAVLVLIWATSRFRSLLKEIRYISTQEYPQLRKWRIAITYH
jgi:hypothetical protein